MYSNPHPQTERKKKGNMDSSLRALVQSRDYSDRQSSSEPFENFIPPHVKNSRDSIICTTQHLRYCNNTNPICRCSEDGADFSIPMRNSMSSIQTGCTLQDLTYTALGPVPAAVEYLSCEKERRSSMTSPNGGRTMNVPIKQSNHQRGSHPTGILGIEFASAIASQTGKMQKQD